MDGNRRWAASRGLPGIAGHIQGVEAIVPVVRHAPDCGIEFLSLYVFSTENWSRTEEEVASWADAGIAISEFPVTAVAAAAARKRGMGIVAGAPNIVRGGSHSGNVRAADLMRDGLVDVFASDYVPGAMLSAALLVHEKLHVPLPAAIATISQRPALMVGLADRGAIAPKLRADLVQVHLADGHPLVRQVWREGKRIA